MFGRKPKTLGVTFDEANWPDKFAITLHIRGGHSMTLSAVTANTVNTLEKMIVKKRGIITADAPGNIRHVVSASEVEFYTVGPSEIPVWNEDNI